MLKRNFWFLVCTRVGISITEEEGLMKEDAMWLLCYERFIETKENFSVQSNVEFIFENCINKDFPPEVLDDIEDRLLQTHGPKWTGLKHDKIKNAFIDETKNHYYVGSRVWETWQESKRYIQNNINPHWQDPKLLPSGFNVTSIMVFIRDTLAVQESTRAAKDNIRNHKNRFEKQGKVFNDEGNKMFELKFNQHLKKIRDGIWFPDCWFSFLAFGAPAQHPAASLWTPREPRNTKKNVKRPINPSQVDLSSSEFKLKKTKTNESSITFQEAATDDYDIVKNLQTLKPIVHPTRTFKSEVSNIRHRESSKLQSLKPTPKPMYQSIATPIKEDPINKAKRLMDDANSVLQIYLSVGDCDADVLETMKKSIRQLATNYFRELSKLKLNTTSTTSASVNNTQSTTSDGAPDLAFDLSSFT
jgi:hypothetical protein